jgi:long-chain acyl-CoA synthetase
VEFKMDLGFFYDVFKNNTEKKCMIWQDRSYTYGDFLTKIDYWRNDIVSKQIESGDIVSVLGDFSPNSLGLLFALIERGCISVPLLKTISKNQECDFFEISQVQHVYTTDSEDGFSFYSSEMKPDSVLFDQLYARNSPGLILFSSGSSGKPKGAVHDFKKLLEKFKEKRASLKILNFLLFDHWGGLNTVFHTLSNAGTVFTVSKRDPASIARLIEKYRVEVLPASPSFLNLFLLSKVYQNHDLSSLKIITYGTEPMPSVTLVALNVAFPNVKLQQTYGLIELGVMRSKSKSNKSLWVKVGGEGFQTRVVDGLLEIKAASAMLGYLNAPSPFTNDGWFMTGDAVEVDGEYLKIIGRKSELINVGGEKVYPQEVECCIQEMDSISDVMVYKEKNPLLGSIVCAKVTLVNNEDHKKIKREIKLHCKERLQQYKIPVKIEINDQSLFNERYKKMRVKSY